MLENPDRISKAVLARRLDSQTAFEIVSIDIADIDVGDNIGARLQADQAEADTRVARANAEGRRAMAVAQEQEMIAQIEESRAKVVEAEAEVPKAIAEAFRAGQLGIMDYYKLRNVQADTEMRKAIAGTPATQGLGASRCLNSRRFLPLATCGRSSCSGSCFWRSTRSTISFRRPRRPRRRRIASNRASRPGKQRPLRPKPAPTSQAELNAEIEQFLKRAGEQRSRPRASRAVPAPRPSKSPASPAPRAPPDESEARLRLSV